MAILNGELSIGQGTPQQCTALLQSLSLSVMGAGIETKLTGYGLINSNPYPFETTLIALVQIIVTQGYYQQYKSSLVRFFGEGARQDTNRLYINKASLPLLTVSSNNRAESLLVALLLQVQREESNDLISRVAIELFKQEFIDGKINTILLVYFYKLIVYVTTLNPNTNRQIVVPQPMLTPNNINS